MTDDIRKQQESLNKFNNEFTDTLNELKEKRKRLIKRIKKEEVRVAALHTQIETLGKEKLTLEAGLSKKNKVLEKMNTTINNTQGAYARITEASHVLLTVLKKDKNQMKE